jgi:LysR family transcriptional regulator, glycine cleavage system transcriptional activator
MLTNSNPPPVQWLPAFESAARLLSFRKAADELCVSPPAVSQQIKSLEEYIGVSLFDRSKKQLSLTDEGQRYYMVASQVIKQHKEGYDQFARSLGPKRLQVSAPIFIAQELLIPNYMKFKCFDENTELRITTGNELVSFDDQQFDAAIRFGAGKWSSLYARPICNVGFCLIASERYLAENGLDEKTFINQELLGEQVLLTLNENLKDWGQIFPNIVAKERIVCDSYFAALRAAEEGLGICVGLTPIINHWLKTRRVVKLNANPIEAELAYWLVSKKTSEELPSLDALYNWVHTLFAQLK